MHPGPSGRTANDATASDPVSTADFEELQPPFRAWSTTIALNAIAKTLTRRRRDAATRSASMVELLDAHPDPQETTTEILAKARKELIRWVTKRIRFEFSDATWNVLFG